MNTRGHKLLFFFVFLLILLTLLFSFPIPIVITSTQGQEKVAPVTASPFSEAQERFLLSERDRFEPLAPVLAEPWVSQPSLPEPLIGEVELKTEAGTPDSGLIKDNLLVVNRFTPSSYPAMLQRVRIRFDQFQGFPSPVGQTVQLVAFLDPHGTGKPPESPALIIKDFVTIPAIGEFSEFELNPVTILSGDLYLGYQVSDPAHGTGFSTVMDGPQSDRAFYSTSHGEGFAGPFQFSSGQHANVCIRAVVSGMQSTDEELKTDDGTLDGRGVIDNGLLIVNRLTPSSYPATLKTIRIYFASFQGYASPVGQSIRLVAFTDPSGSGQPPSNPTLAVNQSVTIPRIGSFVDFAVSGPTISAGDFYVGYQAPNPHNGVGFPVDTNGVAQRRGFFSIDNGVTYLGPIQFTDGTQMNVMIRAVVSKQTGPTGDFSLAANPASQAIAPGGSGVFSVMTTPLNGFAQNISLTTSVSPADSTVQARLATSTVSPGGGTTLTFSTSTGTPQRSYTVTITGTSSGLTHSTSVTAVVISGGTSTMTIEATDNVAAEIGGNSGTVTVTRTDNNTTALTINYQVSGTASAGRDYMALSGGVLMPAGAAKATISIIPLDDSETESTETVIITLTPGSGYQIGTPASATVSILDNESLPTLKFASSTLTVSELSMANCVITATGNIDWAMAVKYRFAGSAVMGNDYLELPETMPVAKGQTQISIPLTLMPDSENEGDETIMVELVPDSTYQIGSPATMTVTVKDCTEPNGAMVDADQGAVVSGEDGAMAIFAPAPGDESFTATWTKTKKTPKKLKVKNDFAPISGVYKLTLAGKILRDKAVVVGFPIAPALLPANPAERVFRLEYQIDGTKDWMPEGMLISFDPVTSSAYFATTIPSSFSAQTETLSEGFEPLQSATLVRTYRIQLSALDITVTGKDPNERFYIVYYPSAFGYDDCVPNSSVWRGCTGGGGPEPFVVDLMNYLNQAYDKFLTLPGTPFTALSLPQYAYVSKLKDAAGESAIGGPLYLSNKLENCDYMKGVAGHELAHVFQGQYFTTGKLGYVSAWLGSEIWFIEASANYMAMQTGMSDTQKKAFLTKDGMKHYLVASLDANDEESYYAAAHFLEWLSNNYGSDFVAKLLAREKNMGGFSMTTHLASELPDRGIKDGLTQVFGDYGVYLMTHPEDMDGLVQSIKSRLSEYPYDPGFADQITCNGPFLSDTYHYVELKGKVNSLAMVNMILSSKNSGDGLFVMDGTSTATSNTLKSTTFDFIGSSNASYQGKTPIDKDKNYFSGGKPITIKHFGSGQPTSSIEQMLVNANFTASADIDIRYYVLQPPTVKTVAAGSITWEFEGVGTSRGLIPPEQIAGFHIYDDTGQQINSQIVKLPASGTQQTYSDSKIAAGGKYTVCIVDRHLNKWPEVKEEDTLVVYNLKPFSKTDNSLYGYPASFSCNGNQLAGFGLRIYKDGLIWEGWGQQVAQNVDASVAKSASTVELTRTTTLASMPGEELDDGKWKITEFHPNGKVARTINITFKGYSLYVTETGSTADYKFVADSDDGEFSIDVSNFGYYLKSYGVFLKFHGHVENFDDKGNYLSSNDDDIRTYETLVLNLSRRVQ